MCGIIGYITNKKASSEVSQRDIASILMVGLERLTYRGYDSSGIAVISDGEINYWKKAGKLKELQKAIDGLTITGTAGIGHTRWATHGEPTDINSHPHVVTNIHNDKKLALVHNGIIENYLSIKNHELDKNTVFASSTDSEVVAHMLQQAWGNSDDLIEIGRQTFSKLEGSFSIAALFEDNDQEMLVARHDSPLIIGIEKEEKFICSDLNTLLFHTKDFIELDNGELALVRPHEVLVYRIDTGEKVVKDIKTIKKEPSSGDKGDFPHYMLKEIYEQPTVCRHIINQYLSEENGNLNLLKLRESKQPIDLKKTNRFLIQACGTSWHSGLIAKYWVEHFARTLTEVDISSELRYRTLLSNENDIILAISQSGETADTLACIREAKSHFLKVISFLNVEKSTIDRESDGIVYSLSGKEIGVASTKNYLAQLVTLYLFTLYLGSIKGTLTQEQIQEKIQEVKKIPNYIEQILNQAEKIKKIADKYTHSSSFIFIGRGVNYPTALEGALKLKEISYLHATGYAAGELKHGPLALIDENLPVICIVPHSPLYSKMISNIQEVKARKGKIIAIASEGDEEIGKMSEDVILIPKVSEELSPLLAVIPLQLFSYHLAVNLGSDVDQPKNLAKSVTVE